MPPQIQKFYDITTQYVRITESPETWFARAKTARKEAPEALAGVHGDYVMMLVDEASGVAEEIFNTAEGALTNENILVILISNPTRLMGTFYDSHHKDKQNWQTFTFNSKESPIVDDEFVTRIIEKHGEDSDEYRIRVLGMFPKEDAIDDKGFVPLLAANDLRYTQDEQFVGTVKMGLDPAGMGKDETVWVVRDPFKAKIVAVEKFSDAKSIAQKTITLAHYYNVDSKNIFIDNFGVGANIAMEMAIAKCVPTPLNVGEKAENDEVYINKRAEIYWRMKEWMRKGGELNGGETDWTQMLTIRYRRELSGKLKIMGKEEMRKEGIKSPDRVDALSLTFVEEDQKKPSRDIQQQSEFQRRKIQRSKYSAVVY